MLLEFSVSNFKCFNDQVCLSMIPDDTVDELNYSLLKEENEKFTINGLSTAVIYGANASGKTNFLKSLDFLKNIVLNGGFNNFSNLKPFEDINLIPNYLEEEKDIKFEITFSVDKDVFEYELFVNLGSFYDSDLDPKITYEKLSMNKATIYIREAGEIKEFYSKTVDPNITRKILTKTLKSNTLFLTNGFSELGDPLTSERIVKWFAKNLL